MSVPCWPRPSFPRPPSGSGVRESGPAPASPSEAAGGGGGRWPLRRARAGAGLEPAASPFSPLSPARRPWRQQQQARSGAATYSSSSSLSPPGHGEHRRAGTDSPPSEPSCPALRDPLLSATPLTAAGRAAAGSPLAPLTRPGWDGRRLPRAGRARPGAPCARGSLPSGSRSGLREGPLEAGGGAAAAAAGGRAAAGCPCGGSGLPPLPAPDCQPGAGWASPWDFTSAVSPGKLPQPDITSSEKGRKKKKKSHFL